MCRAGSNPLGSGTSGRAVPAQTHVLTSQAVHQNIDAAEMDRTLDLDTTSEFKAPRCASRLNVVLERCRRLGNITMELLELGAVGSRRSIFQSGAFGAHEGDGVGSAVASGWWT